MKARNLWADVTVRVGLDLEHSRGCLVCKGALEADAPVCSRGCGRVLDSITDGNLPRSVKFGSPWSSWLERCFGPAHWIHEDPAHWREILDLYEHYDRAAMAQLCSRYGVTSDAWDAHIAAWVQTVQIWRASRLCAWIMGTVLHHHRQFERVLGPDGWLPGVINPGRLGAAIERWIGEGTISPAGPEPSYPALVLLYHRLCSPMCLGSFLPYTAPNGEAALCRLGDSRTWHGPFDNPTAWRIAAEEIWGTVLGIDDDKGIASEDRIEPHELLSCWLCPPWRRGIELDLDDQAAPFRAPVDEAGAGRGPHGRYVLGVRVVCWPRDLVASCPGELITLVQHVGVWLGHPTEYLGTPVDQLALVRRWCVEHGEWAGMPAELGPLVVKVTS